MRKLLSNLVCGSIRIMRPRQGWPGPLKKVLISLVILSALLSSTQLQAAQSGKIVAWGYNDHGQCNIPEPNSGFIAIAAGGGHSLGLKQDGSIVAWGWNNDGQCNIPEPNSGFIAIAAGVRMALSCRGDGTYTASAISQSQIPASPGEGTTTASAISLSPIATLSPSLPACGILSG